MSIGKVGKTGVTGAQNIETNQPRSTEKANEANKVNQPGVSKTSDVSDVYAGAKAKGATGPKVEVWQQGLAPDTGRQQDYGFGKMEFQGNIHGVETSVSYPKANNIPEIEFDPTAPVEQELQKISAQMQALYDPSSIPDDAPPEVAKFRNFDVRAMIRDNLAAAKIVSPFDQEVVINGKTVNLAKAKPESLTPDELTLGLKEILKNQVFTNVRHDIAAFYGVNVPVGSTGSVSGAAAVKKLEDVLVKAVELADTYGYGPPLPPKGSEKRKQYLEGVMAFALKNLFHGENLVAKHVAQGFDVLEKNPDLNETLGHDIIDRNTLRGLLALDERSMEVDWKRAWALDEIKTRTPEVYTRLVPDGASPNDAAKKVSPDAVKQVIEQQAAQGVVYTFNPNSGEPRYLLFMYAWGDQRNETDSDMDPHRAVNHHDGDITQGTLNIEQKRQNGIEHHAGTEHVGVRHEAGLGYQRGEQIPFEQTIRKISADGAFKHPYWRTSAFKDIVLQRIMQEAGIVTPEQLAKIGNPERYLKLDSAYQTLQGANSNADVALGKLRDTMRPVPAVSVALQLIDGLTNAPGKMPASLDQTLASVRVAAGGLAPAEASLLWQYLQAKAIQQAPRSAESAQLFMPVATQAAGEVQALGVAPTVKLSTLSLEKVVELRASLNELPTAAREAREKEGDASLAAVYDVWHDVVTAGFPRIA